MAAGGDNSSAARDALAALCEAYWYPLYAYVRRRGVDADDARDLTQGFLTSLLERRDFETLRPERGRFRAFLLASLKHFLANDAARRSTLKRGGGAVLVPLAFDDAEARYRFEPVEPATPETLYERRWALTIIDRVLAQLASGMGGRRARGGVRRAEGVAAAERAGRRLRRGRGTARDDRRRRQSRRAPAAAQVPEPAARSTSPRPSRTRLTSTARSGTSFGRSMRNPRPANLSDRGEVVSDV